MKLDRELLKQVYRDAQEGLSSAATAMQYVSDMDREDYIRASQGAIRTINRAFGHSMILFLQSDRKVPDGSQHERIHQVRRAHNCPLDQSQINALFDTNRLRNQLVHKSPPAVQPYQVQAAAQVLYAVLPLLIPSESWSDLLERDWTKYGRQLSRWGIRESEPHNLPRPDYNKFIGRHEEISRVHDAFEHPRHWLISIDGIGGVGKSALALHIAYEMAEQIERGICGWKYIVWVSAKTDRLPAIARGIEPQKPGFRVLEDLFDEILLVSGYPDYLDRKLSDKREMVHLVLETHPFLLFIDNFETVEDESVLEFVDNLPGATLSPGHKVVVTSRHRILGRQIRLEGLADWEAAKLIKETARYFGVRKVFADPETQNRVIQETGSVPLALRWVVGQVSLDRSVGDVLSKMSQRVSDIHKFCFDATVAELDTPHLKLLYVLSQLDDPVDEETVANISGLTVEDVGRSLMTLLKYSLVSRKVEQVWETELYQLLPLTATYCAGLGSRWPKYSDEVAERAGVQTQRQRTRAVANGIFKRYRAFTEDDRVAVSAATEALVEYNQRDDLEKALQMLDDAEAMGPTLGYPYLARAQILAQEDRFKEARSYFEKALDRDPQNVDILRNWGELELSTGKYPEAVGLIEQGCQLSPSDVGLRLLLAKATMKNAQLSGTKGHKKERNALLRDALRHAQAAILDSVSTQSEKRQNLECYEVQIQIYLKQDRPDRALEACQEGLALDPDDFTLKTLEPSVKSAVDAANSSE